MYNYNNSVIKKILEKNKYIFRLIKHIFIFGKQIKISKKLTCRIGKYFNLTINNKNSTINIGQNFSCRMYNNINITSGNIEIGKNVFFNNNVSLNCRENITIGDYCIFGEGVKIYDHNHRFNENKNFSEQGFKNNSVEIGKNVWLGSNVIVLKGVRIGDNVVVGAGTVVRKDIDSNSIVYEEQNSKTEYIRFI